MWNVFSRDVLHFNCGLSVSTSCKCMSWNTWTCSISVLHHVRSSLASTTQLHFHRNIITFKTWREQHLNVNLTSFFFMNQALNIFTCSWQKFNHKLCTDAADEMLVYAACTFYQHGLSKQQQSCLKSVRNMKHFLFQ